MLVFRESAKDEVKRRRDRGAADVGAADVAERVLLVHGLLAVPGRGEVDEAGGLGLAVAARSGDAGDGDAQPSAGADRLTSSNILACNQNEIVLSPRESLL